VSVCPLEEVTDVGDCLIAGELQSVSAAYRTSLLGGDHRAALAALAADMDALAGADIAEPLDAAAARVLLVHRWRRIVLRFPEIPRELMPEDTPLADPRADVARAYWRLSEAGEVWMGREFAGLPGLPATGDTASGRFKPSQKA